MKGPSAPSAGDHHGAVQQRGWVLERGMLSDDLLGEDLLRRDGQ